MSESNSEFNIVSLFDQYSIIVPEIQRDYSHGRESASDILDRLLSNIYEVVQGKKPELTLNYIYGVPNGNDITLIDGQQRVTTLYLVRFFFAAKAESEDITLDCNFMSKLKYKTRDSSEQFCEFLSQNGIAIIKKMQSGETPLDSIVNHMQFKKKWINDPTVLSMLNVLNKISEKYNEIENPEPTEYYQNLQNVKFSFISMEGFKRVEELYSAMNSRGKQLTSFELLKGRVLKTKPELAKIINDCWIPWAWNIVCNYPKNNENSEENAAKLHDSYLYNYFTYIVQFVWWSESEKAKQMRQDSKMPQIEEMLDFVLSNTDAFETMKFAMSLLESEFRDDNITNYLERHDEGNNQISSTKVTTNQEKIDFLMECCKGEIKNPGKCLLWAYIKYKFDKTKNPEDNREIVDYFLLMRALYMYAASDKTCTSVNKLSLNETQLGEVIIPFNRITNGESIEKYKHQRDMFYDDNRETKTQLLNNPLVRGIVDNIWEKHNDQMKKNVEWLNSHDGRECFKRLSKINFSSFIIPQREDRAFVTISKKAISSILSIRGWQGSDVFNRFINMLCSTDLEKIEDSLFTPSDWQYYFVEYESFGSGQLGLFDIGDEGCMSMESIFIENQRATSNKTRNPFIYELYITEKNNSSISPGMDYYNYISHKNVKFEKNLNGNYEWTYGGVKVSVENNSDCIVKIKDYLKKNIDKKKL